MSIENFQESGMKQMRIVWKRLVMGGETCTRCGDTGRELEADPRRFMRKALSNKKLTGSLIRDGSLRPGKKHQAKRTSNQQGKVLRYPEQKCRLSTDEAPQNWYNQRASRIAWHDERQHTDSK